MDLLSRQVWFTGPGNESLIAAVSFVTYDSQKTQSLYEALGDTTIREWRCSGGRTTRPQSWNTILLLSSTCPFKTGFPNGFRSNKLWARTQNPTIGTVATDASTAILFYQ